MKSLFVIIILAVAGYYLYQKHVGGPPSVIEDPVYGEMRMTTTVEGREIEAALFLRATSEADCQGRGQLSWSEVFEDCPSCNLQAPKCHDELPPRYARLFDDVPIPSAYLSATAGIAGERDGRIVVYGLTGPEGMQMCELLKQQIAKKYQGQLACVPPSGG